SLWLVQDENGSLARGHYLRGPGGKVEPVGLGSGGEDLEARGRWVGPGGRVVFTSDVPLEQGAPPSGTTAVYERMPGGPTRVVSLLPGETPLSGGESAEYLGVAAGGGAVAFGAGGHIYARVAAAKTVDVVAGAATYGGTSSDGGHVFYELGGDVFAFDTGTGTTTKVGSGGQSTMVNVSADGSHVYFVSPSVLTGGEANSQGGKAAAGKENLYAWDAAGDTVRFVATVEEGDVLGEAPPAGGANAPLGGLGMWTDNAVNPSQGRFRGPANDPSRSSADGSILVFESRAQLTDYANRGHSEIYRYVAAGGELNCVSCSPTEAPASTDARLVARYAPLLSSTPPVNAISQVQNIADGGQVVFFQSAERLAAQDVDGRIDVYEWKAPGVDGCGRPLGCVFLISGGRSAGDDYFYGATPDATTVFFFSGDQLVPQDRDSTPSLYAARIGGGYPPPPQAPPACLGDACQPTVIPPPDPPIASSNAGPPKRKRCLHAGPRRPGAQKSPCRTRHRHHGKHRRSKDGGRQ
ncbi:MAG TPA: hypothetical protein VJQ84_01230, partial [Solirubrobacterales bacterium]|nr:hypothetical protein [Solirubrobacterales bacterium]